MKLATFVALLASAASASTSSPEDGSARGLGSDVSSVWKGISDHIDQFQNRASSEVERLMPFADELGTRFQHELQRMAIPVQNAMDSLDVDVDRDGVEEASDEDEHSSGIRVPYPRMPTLADHMSDAFGGSENMPLSPFSMFGLRRKPWFKGPNVCMDKKVLEEGDGEGNDEEEGENEKTSTEAPNKLQDFIGSLFSSVMHEVTSCANGPDFHQCTTMTHDSNTGQRKVVVVTYKCCYGSTREAGTPGCKKQELRTMVETLNETEEAREFLKLVEATELDSFLMENITVFVPNNDAIEDFTRDLEEVNLVSGSGESYNVDEGLSNRRRRKRAATAVVSDAPELPNLVKGHFVDGFVSTSDLRDEEVLETKQTGNKLRFTVYNTYPERTYMANCARIISRDHFTKNGVVHMVDRVIQSTTRNISDILHSDLEFVSFAKALDNSGITAELLEAPDAHLTIFVPTEEAFSKLDADLKQKLVNGTTGCSKEILKNLILPSVICSGAITTKSKTVNILRKHISMDVDEEGNFLVEGHKVTIKDIVATNGVIHVIEDVFLPNSSRNVVDALKESGNRTTLISLVQSTAFDKILQESSNFTLLGPSEDALKDLDQENAIDVLKFHTVTPKLCQCKLQNNMLLNTLNDKKVRINIFAKYSGFFGMWLARPMFTAQCKPLVSMDTEVCGGMIHTVDGLMEPSAGSVFDIVKARDDLTQFNKLLDAAQVSSLSDLLGEDVSKDTSLTLFVPNDAAFQKLVNLDALFSDSELAKAIVKNHFTEGVLCCAGINHDLQGNTNRQTLLGNSFYSVKRSAGDRYYMGSSELIECDRMSDEGVIHVVDSVNLPRVTTTTTTGRGDGMIGVGVSPRPRPKG